MKHYLLLILLLLMAGCSQEPEELIADEPINPLLETYFDMDYTKDYTDITYPRHYDNETLNDDNTPANNMETNDAIILGRVLFYDKNLSVNNSVSCSSCHQQSSGFTDSKTLSEGFEGGLTGAHSMRIANVRFYEGDDMFWDRRANSLEDQASQPIQNEVEMGFDATHGGFDALITKLEDVEYYPILFEEAFGSSEITEQRVQKALAQFMRNIVSTTSRFDDGFSAVYTPGTGGPGPGNNTGLNDDFPNFTAEENLGKALFFGRAQCDQCHRAPTFSLRGNSRSNGLDAGETIIFKTSSLKNVGVSGPYMHDGRLATLAEVVDHYNSEIQAGPALDNDLQNNNGPERLNLSQQEKDAIVAFLHTLTDESNLTNPDYSDPFINQN